MIKVDLRTIWRIRSEGQERELDQLLITILAGLEETGKLTAAAKLARISHRHAYNLINGWGSFLGAPLVVMKQGLGTRLTPLGERMLWAGRRVQTRLAPELDGLAGDFAREINGALGSTDPVLVIHASHDFAVALLVKRVAGQGLAVDLQSRGSFDALASLMRHDCVVAGFHVADAPLGRLLARRYAEGLAGRDLRLLPLAHRQQGLIVARGNPRGILGVADLAREGVRFINRQRGSGTRALLEFLLTEAGVDRRELHGYDSEEITHSAVAALVAGRQADAGFGLETAAVRFNLGFVPIASESYFLGVAVDSLQRADVQALLASIAQPAFAAAVNAIPGYRACDAAPLSTVAEVLGRLDAQATLAS
jgi:molybdate transport repressor ModE-like protein